MNWSVEFQFAGLLVALMVAIMCFGQRRLNFYAEKAFERVLVAVIASVVLDILHVYSIRYVDNIGNLPTEWISRAYLISIMAVVCLTSLYAAEEIRYRTRPVFRWLTLLPLLLGAVLTFFFPIEIHNVDRISYITGVPTQITSSVMLVYIASTIAMFIVRREKINLKRRFSICALSAIWMVIAIVQLVYAGFQIGSFAMALSCMYLFCRLENPEYYTDMLTGVYDRKGFELIAKDDLANRIDKSVLAFSIGNVAMVSEIFGSRAVEKLIIMIAEFADKISNTTLFRIEENLFYMTAEGKEDIERATEILTKRFETPWEIGGISVEVSVTATYFDKVTGFTDFDNLFEVIRFFATESTKRGPGNVLYVGANELNARKRNMTMLHVIDWAIKNNGVEVYYQPIYKVGDGRFSALEALVRIRDENGTIYPPASFIEFAEQNGLITRLGNIVFKKVCEFMQRMHVENYGIDYISVNLSLVQCMQENLGKMLKNIMAEYQIAPYRISFEVTENGNADSQRIVDKAIQELIDYGSSFSLDDYGKGYSNINNIVNLPIKRIKLNERLVEDYFTSPKTKIATEAAIKMIHDVGMEVVVEGIENEEQYQAFKNLGVEYIQGFYFCKPLPKAQVLNFVQEWL